MLIGQISPIQRDEMRHAAHMLLAKGDPNPTSPADWPRYRGLLPHVRATQWLGRALRLLGHYDGAREVNEHALAWMRVTLGEEHENHEHNLG